MSQIVHKIVTQKPPDWECLVITFNEAQNWHQKFTIKKNCFLKKNPHRYSSYVNLEQHHKSTQGQLADSQKVFCSFGHLSVNIQHRH